MRFHFISVICVSGALLTGCGGGTNEEKRSEQDANHADSVDGETEPNSLEQPEKSGDDLQASSEEVLNGSPSEFGQVTKQLNFSIESKQEFKTYNDISRLKYFGFERPKTKLIGEFDGIRIFEGPDLAKAQGLKPGIHVRCWHDMSWGLTTVKCMCGEVLGVFEIDGRRVTIDLLMTYAARGKSIDWSTQRGTVTKKPQCAHSGSDSYDSIYYNQPAISDDIARITDPVEKVSSLIMVVFSIGKIVMGKESELPNGIENIGNGHFVSLATENLKELIKTDFIPGIIVVTNPW